MTTPNEIKDHFLNTSPVEHFGNIGQGLSNAGQWTKDHVLEPAGEKGWELLNMDPIDHGNALARNAQEIGTKAVEVGKDGVEAVGNGLGEAGHNIKTGIEGAQGWVGDKVGDGLSDVGDKLSGAGDNVSEHSDSLTEASKSEYEGFSFDDDSKDAAKAVGGGISASEGSLQDIRDKVKETSEQAKDAAKDAAQDSKEEIQAGG